MWTAIQSVLAIIIVIAVGAFAGKKDIISKDLSGVFSSLVMNFTFPAVLFVSMATTSISNLLNFRFLLVFFLALMGIYFLVFYFCVKVLKRSKQVAAMIAFACSFPNMAFMGIPYLTEVLGSASVISVAIGNVITSVVMIPMTMIFLEDKGSGKGVFKQQMISVVKKPLVIAPVLGVIFAVCNIPLPDFIIKGLKILGSGTSPIALFALGLMMVKFKFTLSKDSVINIILKLLIQPLIAVLFIFLFHVRGMFAQEIIILTAMPSAIIVSMFAEKYNVYKEETVSTIIGSSILSIVTLVVFTVIAGWF